MMPRRNNRTYRSPAAAHSKVVAARRELLAEEEPMHRYPHPIPQTTATAAPELSPAGDMPAAMTQALEQLSCQSQLLVDLLGAVNSLTAAILCQTGKV